MRDSVKACVIFLGVPLLLMCAIAIGLYEPSKSVDLTDRFVKAARDCDEDRPMIIGKAQYAGRIYIEVSCSAKAP